jgi:O-antigen/teichoic acid export membrane protein
MLRLLYGDKYLAAAPLLMVLGVLLVIQGFIHPAGQQLVANHRQRLRYKLQIVVAVVFVAANLLVIPRYGAMGAAVVSVACRLLLLLLFTAALWRDGFAVRKEAGDAHISLALAIGGLTALAVHIAGIPAWGTGALLLAVYGGTLLLLRKKIGALAFLQKMAA